MDATTLLPDQQEGEEDEEEEGSVGGPQLVPADSGVGQSGIHSHSNKKPCSQVLRILISLSGVYIMHFAYFSTPPYPRDSFFPRRQGWDVIVYSPLRF